jgi:hypothetical protein
LTAIIKKNPEKGQGGKDMTGKATTVFLAAMFASQVALTAVSFADGKKGKSSFTVTNFKAKLAPPLGAPVECEGEAKYTKKVSNPPALPSTEEAFNGEVECPVSDVGLAQSDVYDMHLFHAADLLNPYAVCSLVIKEFEFEYQSDPLVPAGVEGEYVVSVSQKTTLKQKVGRCIITETGLAGVPAVQATDTVNVFLHPDTLTPLLTGTFM